MSKARLKRLEAALQAAKRSRILDTPEERRQFLAENLPSLCHKVFGADDPRAEPAHLADMTLEQLLGVYRAAIEESIARWRAANPPELEAFRRLPVSEKIRILCAGRLICPAELQERQGA